MPPAATLTSAGPSPPVGVAARASWTGQLAFGPLTLPVKAYPTVVVPSHGPLHQIHSGCGERISQRKVCPKHGELTAADIGKAFEYGPNDQLTFSAEELDALTPRDDRTIRVEHLMPSNRFEPSLLSGRSLYLVPLHVAAAAAYAQAIVLLSTQNMWAIGRVILSDQRRAIALRVESRRLVLYVLHWPEHRRASPGADVDTDSVVGAELRALEKALLPLHKSFAWEAYRDDSSDRLNELIATKVAARHATVPKRTKGTAVPTRTRRAA